MLRANVARLAEKHQILNSCDTDGVRTDNFPHTSYRHIEKKTKQNPIAIYSIEKLRNTYFYNYMSFLWIMFPLFEGFATEFDMPKMQGDN